MGILPLLWMAQWLEWGTTNYSTKGIIISTFQIQERDRTPFIPPSSTGVFPTKVFLRRGIPALTQHPNLTTYHPPVSPQQLSSETDLAS
jgi:hypothetical protein